MSEDVVVFVSWMGVLALLVSVVWYILDRKLGMNEEKQMIFIVPGLVAAMFLVFGFLFWWGFFLLTLCIICFMVIMAVLEAGRDDDEGEQGPNPPGGGGGGPRGGGTPPDDIPPTYLDTPDVPYYDDVVSEELVGV